MSFKRQSLTSTEVVSETGRTLAAFQCSDTLGSIANMLHYYSNSEDKQGHETKREEQHEEQTEQLSVDRRSVCHFVQPLHRRLAGVFVKGFTC